ncbi:PREDICTED: agamous-like MADS-box protein AGL8 homolog [Ipomoea nil]|uniref:agamous-like MADS-box protein AGL8 homolog n=1 Tax=Ipomoea nil TaxID=35883 RepID=UPI000901617B|nr:PREDICTED: agamous-like MADS-box protein AGL8 homolog [Ipomoea nil]
MGRAKLNLELIPKEKARNLTFKKRKEGIMKKMREFTTLCDVNACMIIYGPNSQSSEPAIWPNDRSEVERMIELYKEKVADNSTRSYGISNFFMDRKKKLEEEVRKLKQKNLEAKYPTNLEFMDRMSKPELENFVRFLDGKLEAAAARMEMMNEISNNNGELQQQSQAMQIFPGYNNQDYYIDPMQIDNLGYVTNPLHHQHVVYNSPNVILDDDQEKNYGLLGYANPNPTPGPGRMMIPPEYMHFTGGASSSSSAGAGPGGFIIYNNDSFPAGYRQQQVNLYEPMMSNVMAQYSIDRTTMQLTMVPPPPPYMGGDLPPLPPCYLEMNEVKCTLPALPAGGVNLPPQISPSSYYLEEKENNNNYLPPPAGGSGLPQLPPPRSCMEDKEVASSSSITHYQVTNQITRFS